MSVASPTYVASIEAERAIRLAMVTVAQHRRQEAQLRLAGPSPRGRLSAALVGPSSSQVRCQATLVRLSSIVEAFTAHQLVVRSERHAPPPRSAILDDIYVRAEDSAIASWPKMEEHYGRWFKITLSACPAWPRVKTIADARNAIAHGLGELTRRMSRRDASRLTADFAALGMVISGNTILLSQPALRQCASRSREFVVWLDEALATYDSPI